MEFSAYLLLALKFLLFSIVSFLFFSIIVLLIILFIPIRYYASCEKEDDVEFIFKTSWLFSILKISYELKGENSKIVTKIFGLEIGKKSDKYRIRDRIKKQIKKLFGLIKNWFNKLIDEFKQLNIKSKKKSSNLKDNDKIEINRKNATDVNKYKEIDNNKNKEENEEQPKVSLKQKYDNLKIVLKPYIQRIKFILEYEDRNEIFRLTINLIKKLFKQLNLSFYDFNLEIGLQEKDKTGIILGIIGAISGLLAININAEGNFEKEVLNFSGKLKGKIFIFKLILPIIIFVLKKPIRKIIKTIIWEDEKNVK